MSAEIKEGPWKTAPVGTTYPEDFPRYRATHALLFAVAINGGDALDDMAKAGFTEMAIFNAHRNALLGGLITTQEIPLIDATGAWVHHVYVLTDAGRDRLHVMNAKGERTKPKVKPEDQTNERQMTLGVK